MNESRIYFWMGFIAIWMMVGGSRVAMEWFGW